MLTKRIHRNVFFYQHLPVFVFVGKGRNPFSEAKLKACNVSEADLPAIKAAINKYIKVDNLKTSLSHTRCELVFYFILKLINISINRCS